MTDKWRNWLEPAEAVELAAIEANIARIDADLAFFGAGRKEWCYERRVLRNRARQRRLRANG